MSQNGQLTGDIEQLKNVKLVVQQIDELNGLANGSDELVWDSDDESKTEASNDEKPVSKEGPPDSNISNSSISAKDSEVTSIKSCTILMKNGHSKEVTRERTTQEEDQLLRDCFNQDEVYDNASNVSRSPVSDYQDSREYTTQELEENEHNGVVSDSASETTSNEISTIEPYLEADESESSQSKRKKSAKEGGKKKTKFTASDESDLEMEQVIDEKSSNEEKDGNVSAKADKPQKKPKSDSPKKNSSLGRKNIKFVDDDELDEQVALKRKEEEDRIKRQNQAMELLKEQRRKENESKKLSLEALLATPVEKSPRSKEIDEICLSSDDEEDIRNSFMNSRVLPSTSSPSRPFGGRSLLDSVSSSNLNHYQRALLSQFGGSGMMGSSPIAGPSRARIEEARNEIIDLDDDNVDAKWKYGTQHQYTDDDLEDIKEEDCDLDEDGNPSGTFTNDRENKPDTDGKLLVNVTGVVSSEHPEKPIYLPAQIAQVIKPHQVGGVRFMWANIVDTLATFNSKPGVGCVLAHAMGLGKTIQVVSFTHVFLTHTPAKHVLIIVPINTLQNWVAEFNQWSPSQSKITDFKTGDNSKLSRKNIEYRVFYVYELSEQKNVDARHKEIKKWRSTGGVMLLGYEMYRIMTDPNTWSKPARKLSHSPETLRRMVQEVREALVDPGPDLIVCDEGHRIKNDATGVSKAVKEIRTQRRIVLTGYPLQNNLMEYWCMVDFIRPGYLGTKEEFANRFEKPIKNGQFQDSRPFDKDIMRRRAFVLADMLKGFVQRRSHDILCSTLPRKHELVLLLRMTDIQKKLFEALFAHLNKQKMSPIILFSICNKIWNHPDILYSVVREGLSVEDMEDEVHVGLLSNRGKAGPKKNKAGPSSDLLQGSAVNPRALDLSWAEPVFADYKTNVVENSHKMVLLFELIDRTIEKGEKILVFSQSLLTLNIIEHYLSKRTVPKKLDQTNNPKKGVNEDWTKGVNYYRIDGSTSSMDRDSFINTFNRNPMYKLFLLSTRAGCLGINLVGASRIVIFDVSWNPCHDAQAACRIYRYGQTKETFIYRLVADNSLEKKVFDRAISKQGMSNRVVDEENPETILQAVQVMSLVEGLDIINEPEVREFDLNVTNLYDDEVIQTICVKYNYMLTKEPFKHESLLLHDRKTALSKEQKIMAKTQFEIEKNSKQYAGRNSWIHGPPTTSMFPGIDYKPPERRFDPFRPLAEGHPKWLEVKGKLDSKGYRFLKRSRMPTQLKLQDRVTGAPNYIHNGEEVDFFRNPNLDTLLVTHDCKVVEIRGSLVQALNVDSLDQSNIIDPTPSYSYGRPQPPPSIQLKSGTVPIVPRHNSVDHNRSLLSRPTSTLGAQLPQFPRRIDPGSSLHHFTSKIPSSTANRPIPVGPSAAIASSYNPYVSSRGSLLPNPPVNGGMRPVANRSQLPQTSQQSRCATTSTKPDGPDPDPVVVDLSDDDD